MAEVVPPVLAEIQAGDGLSLSAAGRLFPGHRGGKSVDPSTVFRWVTRGSRATDGRAVKLEAVRAGGRWLTSRGAVARFVAALTGAGPPTPSAHTPRAPPRNREGRRRAPGPGRLTKPSTNATGPGHRVTDAPGRLEPPMKTTVTSGTADFNPDRLLPQHLADLKRSGLRDETIVASGVYSEAEPDRVRDLLGGYLSLKTARAMGACLAFPSTDAEGNPVTWLPPEGPERAAPRPFVRLKPDKPRKQEGKPVKYESPLKSGNRVYVPPGVGATLADATKELVVVEGEKKALAGMQDGFPTVGLSGVWNWAVKRPRNPATGREQGRGS